MSSSDSTYVPKACAYITRNGDELLVFRSPTDDRLQVPKGTVESGETPREALFREVAEESGLCSLSSVQPLARDVWFRREGRWYVRNFFHASVYEPRDSWTHVVTGAGEERGREFEYSWVDLESVPGRAFAMDLDDYVPLLESGVGRGEWAAPAEQATSD
ncbi:NUDIX hydrolase [Natrononativus amylolyticus]|uniref:NUDIX hydrolase n=1 Tax=Natrononativus amylolyticus TaxID=2963434 RepID=UPI0020CCBAAB|nr:NUDIX domain-containing protein [Natrononativus amylolyticus]